MRKNKPVTAKTYLREQNTRKDGKAPIYLRITQNRKPVTIHLKEYCPIWAWDKERTEVMLMAKNPDTGKRQSVPHARAINQRIKAAHESIFDIAEKLLANNRLVGLDDVLEMYHRGSNMGFITITSTELKAKLKFLRPCVMRQSERDI